jgi:hypothetical protein
MADGERRRVRLFGQPQSAEAYALPYDAVRTAAPPDTALLNFLQSTYEAAAEAGKWDRAALECAPGSPGVPRAIS